MPSATPWPKGRGVEYPVAAAARSPPLTNVRPPCPPGSKASDNGRSCARFELRNNFNYSPRITANDKKTPSVTRKRLMNLWKFVSRAKKTKTHDRMIDFFGVIFGGIWKGGKAVVNKSRRSVLPALFANMAPFEYVTTAWHFGSWPDVPFWLKWSSAQNPKTPWWEPRRNWRRQVF